MKSLGCATGEAIGVLLVLRMGLIVLLPVLICAGFAPRGTPITTHMELIR